MRLILEFKILIIVYGLNFFILKFRIYGMVRVLINLEFI